MSVEAPINRPKPMVILIAGPYRSGTKGDPVRIAQNLDRLESFALSIYKAGHIPVIGEWVALPLMKQAGSLKLGDEISEQYLRLLERCDAVLRIEGESKGADEDLRLRANGGCKSTGAWKMCRFSLPQRSNGSERSEGACTRPFRRGAFG